MDKCASNTQVDMTVGSPLGLILRFTLPMMVGNPFQQLYNLVDSIVVGRFVAVWNWVVSAAPAPSIIWCFPWVTVFLPASV